MGDDFSQLLTVLLYSFSGIGIVMSKAKG